MYRMQPRRLDRASGCKLVHGRLDGLERRSQGAGRGVGAFSGGLYCL
jgi:hypothetical protein